jgi:acyl-[acyl-carrier-protein]-phospholipid O-acyltransferase / long-chain-fatty-acid--[acyl-carrier-protein] ligase
MKKLFNIIGAIPFLTAVFLNTVVDLGHKIVIQNTVFKVYDGSEQVFLTATVNALILLPFILMFSTAGFLSDKYAKSSVMKGAAWVAVGLTCGITLFYSLGWFWPAFGMTFLLAAQSAIYSPAKYGYIKSLFGKENLAQGNGLVQAISIIGILSGTLLFSILFESFYPEGALSKSEILVTLIPVGYILIATSILELIMMYRLPQLEQTDHQQKFDMSEFAKGQMTKDNLRPVLKSHVIFQSIIGLSLFWSIGQVMLAAFPSFAKQQTGETNTVIIQIIMAVSGIGIAMGSMIAARASRNYIETGLIPVAAAGIAAGLFLLPGLHDQLWMGLDFMFIGAMGGLLIVPLNSLIQFHAGSHQIGRVLAANNLIQNISMLLFLMVTVIFSLAQFESSQLLYLISLVALIGFGYSVYQLPQSLVRFILSYVMSARYRVRVEGMQNLPSTGGVLLLGNHISWLDWAIVQIACPRPVRFVMIRNIYERWYLNWFFKMFGCIPIESGIGSKKALEQMTQLLNDGEVVCLFPEGTISRNGQLSEFKHGYEKAAQAANDEVVIVPFYLHGLWGSQFSRANPNFKNMRKTGQRRDLSVSFGDVLDRTTGAEILKRRVFDLSIQAWQSFVSEQPSLADSWIETIKRNPLKMALADTMGQTLTSYKLLTAAVVFSRRIRRLSTEQNIGLLLPTSSAGIITNMAGLLAGKTLVNLNYSASSQAFTSALQQAGIRTVYTSQRFLDKLSKRGLDFSELLQSVEVVFLEDLKQSINKAEMFAVWLSARVLPCWLLRALYSKNHDAEQTAAILFSSGSEGLPKGIQLSHHNIIANLKQVAEVLNAESTDRVLASLPLFHAFGLTVTQFLPLIEGLPVICHADPTDSLGVAKAVAKYKATIMCATSTFLRLYTRDSKAKPLMMDSLRLVVSGAERLNPDVRDAFKLKFGKDIYEGYGATETAPVASVNLPDNIDPSNWKQLQGHKPGTVGLPLPGTSFKVVDPQSLEELETGSDGLVLIAGPQVMQGYLDNAEKTAAAIHQVEGIRWYATGDKGHLDEDGYLTIVDRYSRFAKIGGEMISLGEVEQAVANSLDNDDAEVIAINLPDDKKGERVVLLTEQSIELKSLKQAILEKGVNPLLIPAEIITVDSLPKLGSGKTDYVQAKKIASSY